jgi:nicotinate-nucleotide pyrophosphorylase (carboxylating)
VAKDFQQITWDADLADDWQQLLVIALGEDLRETGDCTTQALVPPTSKGVAHILAREEGVVCGILAAEMAFREFDATLDITLHTADGHHVQRDTVLLTVAGSARSLLTAERTVLNVLGRLSGIATLTQQYVAAIAATDARIYDTRKTTPAWRRLEKYAVRCGGGHNHRTGLYDAILIKDNHLAFCRDDEAVGVGPAAAVRRARTWLGERQAGSAANLSAADLPIVEIEVDTLEQLVEVLAEGPDVVLLDNMTPEQLRRAVAIRDGAIREGAVAEAAVAEGGASDVQLEASGGINLDTVAAVAAAGVDRISVGALTHSAASLDVAMDWR